MSVDKARDAAVGSRQTLLLLWAVFAVAQLDRFVLSFSLDAISLEFGLSNSQLGLLSGFAFVLVFALVGFPVAALCARYNRRNLVAASVVIWSGFTLISAAAQNFAQLFLARIGVGSGEAGAVAPAHSMISDLFPPGRHASALSTFATGANIGGMLAALVGGVIGQAFGWRWAFLVAGLPGLLLAALLLRFGTEPRRVLPSNGLGARALFGETLQRLLSDQGSRSALIAFSIMGVTTFAMTVWVPIVFIRQFGLGLAQTGGFLALTFGTVGALGTYLGGQLIDRVGRRAARYRQYLVIGSVLLHTLLSVLFLMAPSAPLGMALFAASLFFSFQFWGPTFAYVYQRVDSHLRPMATAFFLLCFNLVGMGVGPTVAGVLSDAAFAELGAQSTAAGLVVVKLAGLSSVLFFLRMARQVVSAPVQPAP